MTPATTNQEVGQFTVSTNLQQPEVEKSTMTEADNEAIQKAVKQLEEKRKSAIKKYGDVPVIYTPTKAMTRPPADPGLLHFIENSMTMDEVLNYVKKGIAEYKTATPKTIKRWKKAAEKRIEELSK
jgi:hypothetical protein